MSLYFSNTIYSLGTKKHALCVLVFHTPDQFCNTEVQNALCAPRGAFCSICPSVNLSLQSLTLEVLLFFMHPALQGGVWRSRWLERCNLKAVHLKSSICLCSFLCYFVFVLFCFLHSTHPLPYTLDAVCLLTLGESLAVALIKKLHKCNKQETGVLSVYLYFPPGQ